MSGLTRLRATGEGEDAANGESRKGVVQGVEERRAGGGRGRAGSEASDHTEDHDREKEPGDASRVDHDVPAFAPPDEPERGKSVDRDGDEIVGG